MVKIHQTFSDQPKLVSALDTYIYKGQGEKMLATVSQQLAEKEIKLEVTDAAKDFLSEKGYDVVFGARPLRRVIQNMVEDKLSDSLLRGQFRVGDTAVVDREGDEIVVQPAAVGALLGDAKP